MYLLPSPPMLFNMSPCHLHVCCLFFIIQSPITAASWNADLALWLDLVQVTTAALSSWVQWPCHLQKTPCHSTPPPPLAYMFFLPLLGSCSLSLSGGGGDTDVSSVNDCPSSTFSQHGNKFLVWIAAHCRKSLPLLGMGAALFRHKHKEGSSATCPCQKMVVVIALLGPVTDWTVGFWLGLQYHKLIPSCGADLGSNQKALGSSHNLHAIISPQGHTLFCQIGIAAFSTQPSKATTDALSPSVHDR